MAPALLVAVTAPSLLYGRAIHGIAWVWPATLLVFTAQAGYATVRRLVTPAIGVPILLYDLLLAVVALARYASLEGDPVPAPLLALGAAHAGAVSFALGQAALWSPLAVAVPLVAPAYPARFRLSAAVRIAYAVIAAALTLLVTVVELPRAVRNARAFAELGAAPLQPRPEDFTVGVRVFPELRDVPPPPVLRHELALVDTLDAGAVYLVVAPEAARGATLDSLARVVESLRGDSTLVIVALGYARNARERWLADPARYTATRARDAHEIVRRLRPDVFLPAERPSALGNARLGRLTPQQWADYVGTLARAAREARPRTRIGLAASTYDAADSALFAWAARPDSPVDLPGFVLFPSVDGAAGLRARQDAADRWMAAVPTARKHYWVYAAGGYPHRQGERSQRDAVWATLAWAAERPGVAGVVVADGGDYETLTGIRASTGRLREVAGAVREAMRRLAGAPE